MVDAGDKVGNASGLEEGWSNEDGERWIQEMHEREISQTWWWAKWGERGFKRQCPYFRYVIAFLPPAFFANICMPSPLFSPCPQSVEERDRLTGGFEGQASM